MVTTETDILNSLKFEETTFYYNICKIFRDFIFTGLNYAETRGHYVELIPTSNYNGVIIGYIITEESTFEVSYIHPLYPVDAYNRSRAGSFYATDGVTSVALNFHTTSEVASYFRNPYEEYKYDVLYIYAVLLEKIIDTLDDISYYE